MAEGESDIPVGTQLKTKGLSNAVLNDQTCVCAGPTEGSADRVQVRLASGRELAVRKTSLEKVSSQ